MNNFVWIREFDQIDVWQILEQRGENIFVKHTVLNRQKWAKLADTRNHWVWYLKKGIKTFGFVYQRRGRKLLVEIPVSGLGKELWLDESQTQPVADKEASQYAEFVYQMW